MLPFETTRSPLNSLTQPSPAAIALPTLRSPTAVRQFGENNFKRWHQSLLFLSYQRTCFYFFGLLAPLILDLISQTLLTYVLLFNQERVLCINTPLAACGAGTSLIWFSCFKGLYDLFS
jgi:hypothetical protein